MIEVDELDDELDFEIEVRIAKHLERLGVAIDLIGAVDGKVGWVTIGDEDAVAELPGWWVEPALRDIPTPSGNDSPVETWATAWRALNKLELRLGVG